MDYQKLKYDLAIASAIASTILHPDKKENVAGQILEEFKSAYTAYSMMDIGNFAEVQRQMAISEKLVTNLAATVKPEF